MSGITFLQITCIVLAAVSLGAFLVTFGLFRVWRLRLRRYRTWSPAARHHYAQRYNVAAGVHDGLMSGYIIFALCCGGTWVLLRLMVAFYV